MSSRYREKVGAGATTTAPSATDTESAAWITSLEPLPTSTPSAIQPCRSAIAAESCAGEKAGYRCQGSAAARARISRLRSSGTSTAASFWLSFRATTGASRV